MHVIASKSLPAVVFDSEKVRGVQGRILIGKEHGALHFCMRRFDLSPDGHTPEHVHDWEHEIFVHAGQGEVFLDGQFFSMGAGHVVFIPGGVPHQIRNTGTEDLVFICLVPSGAPEL